MGPLKRVTDDTKAPVFRVAFFQSRSVLRLKWDCKVAEPGSEGVSQEITSSFGPPGTGINKSRAELLAIYPGMLAGRAGSKFAVLPKSKR